MHLNIWATKKILKSDIKCGSIQKVTVLFYRGAMSTKADVTRESIIKCARQEFLEVGFHDASLRKIAAAAKVTTGAIYRYFEDKKALFLAATENASTLLIKRYSAMVDKTLTTAAQGIFYQQTDSKKDIAELYNIVYDYFDEFYLLLICADGSETVSFLHSLVELEEKSTLDFFHTLCTYYKSDFQFDRVALHFLIEAYTSALFEPIRHKMPKDDAIRHAQALTEYFSIGWRGIEKIITDASNP